MIVVDASVIVEVLLPTDVGERLRPRLTDRAIEVWAPYLLDIEVMQALRKYQATGFLDPSASAQLVVDFADMSIIRYQHEPLLPRIWELRHNLTAYDATYLALAEILSAPLLTCDAGMARAPGSTATVEFIQK